LNKERLAAFTDAVLAIIMTILVLELEKPKVVSVQGLWQLRESFLAYTISFFWIGLTWAAQHSNWQRVEKVNEGTGYTSLLMLFMASFFPYTTSLVATNFSNATAQALYGIIVLAVTFSNILITQTLRLANPQAHFGLLYSLDNRSVILDIVIKVVSLILAITIFPPAMVWSVFLGMLIVVFDSVIRALTKH